MPIYYPPPSPFIGGRQPLEPRRLAAAIDPPLAPTRSLAGLYANILAVWAMYGSNASWPAYYSPPVYRARTAGSVAALEPPTHGNIPVQTLAAITRAWVGGPASNNKRPGIAATGSGPSAPSPYDFHHYYA